MPMSRLFGKLSPRPSSASLGDQRGMRNRQIIDSLSLDAKYYVEFSQLTCGNLLGEGGFAKVYQCELNGQKAVCKQLPGGKLDKEAIYLLKNEVTVWARLLHEHVVGFLGIACSTDTMCLLCEYMPDGTLDEKHERRRTAHAAALPEAVLIRQLHQVASGMDYLHAFEPPVLHRDLKSSNVLLHGKRLAIADFGLARYQDEKQMTAETGSYRWMAPEVIRHEKYDQRCDIYSFAVLGWEMLTDWHGKRPQLPEGAPVKVVHLIKLCWSQDAKQRPPFRKICFALTEEIKASAELEGGTSEGESDPVNEEARGSSSSEETHNESEDRIKRREFLSGEADAYL